LSEAIDLSEMVDEPTPDAAALAAETAKDRQSRIKYNVRCAIDRRAERARQEKYDSGIAALKDAFASVIADMLRSKAPARLRALKAAHATNGSGREHDGLAMYEALVALKSHEGPTAKRSSEWHEAQYWSMNGEVLADHCGVGDYVSKINTFLEIHLPNFKRLKFENETLSDVYIDWLPTANAGEVRTLRRELTEKRDRRNEALAALSNMTDGAVKIAAEAAIALMPKGIDDAEHVLLEATKIISGSADSVVMHARLAASSLPTSTVVEAVRRDAAIAAAAAMQPGQCQPATAPPPGGGGGGGGGNAAATQLAATAKKARKVEDAKRALVAAAGRAGKENTRESKLLPIGQWCPSGCCRWPHSASEPCYSNPDWEGPLSAEIEGDPKHVARIEKRRIACADRLHKEGRMVDGKLVKRSSNVPKKLLLRSARPRAHAAKHGLAVVMVDKKVGGYEHDLTFGPVIDDLEMILRHSSCTGLFFSTPCGTWTALRYLRPGPPVLRRLASAANQWKDEVLGILRPDGTFVQIRSPSTKPDLGTSQQRSTRM
jgi:hypothetical protein